MKGASQLLEPEEKKTQKIGDKGFQNWRPRASGSEEITALL